MKLKKIALMATSMALVAALAVGGTLAYLTSTDTVTNTFTVGNVSIKLDEAKVGTDGKALTGESAERVKENSYKLMPGHTYDKDPTVTVLKGSESSYVRMLVTVTFGKELTEAQLATKLDGIFTGYDSKWVRNGDPKAETKTNGDSEKYTVVTYEYRYNTTVAGVNTRNESADNKLPALFTGITIPSDWDGQKLADIGGFTISIEAQAIQADGFNDAAAAWTAFEGKTESAT